MLGPGWYSGAVAGGVDAWARGGGWSLAILFAGGGGAGGSGSSFRILMMFDLLAGTTRAGPAGGAAGVELGRGISLTGDRLMMGE